VAKNISPLQTGSALTPVSSFASGCHGAKPLFLDTPLPECPAGMYRGARHSTTSGASGQHRAPARPAFLPNAGQRNTADLVFFLSPSAMRLLRSQPSRNTSAGKSLAMTFGFLAFINRGSRVRRTSFARALGGLERCAGAHYRQTLAAGELGLTGNEANSRARKEADASAARGTPNSYFIFTGTSKKIKNKCIQN
jgi:hypothetical protein